MDLVNLMQSLSVNEIASEEVKSPNLKVFNAVIGENKTDCVYGIFTNKYMVIATQYSKIGSLLKISLDHTDANREHVYTIHTLFGEDSIEQRAAGRYIAEALGIDKPLMLFLCLKHYDQDTIKAVAEEFVNIRQHM